MAETIARLLPISRAAMTLVTEGHSPREAAEATGMDEERVQSLIKLLIYRLDLTPEGKRKARER